jgi:hypothetical protein
MRASDIQTAFRAYARGRRTKLAKLAQTTLVKADQWARGDAISSDIAVALENALKTLKAKKK